MTIKNLDLSRQDQERKVQFDKTVEHRSYDWEPRATADERKTARAFLKDVENNYPLSIERESFLAHNYTSLARAQGSLENEKSNDWKQAYQHGSSLLTLLYQSFYKEDDRNKKFLILEDIEDYTFYSRQYSSVQLAKAKFAEFVGDFMTDDETTRVFIHTHGELSKDGCYALAFALAGAKENADEVCLPIYDKIKDKSCVEPMVNHVGIGRGVLSKILENKKHTR